MLDPEFVKELINAEHPHINFNGQFFGIDALDLVLTVLKARGEIRITNVGNTATAMELGAGLQALAGRMRG